MIDLAQLWNNFHPYQRRKSVVSELCKNRMKSEEGFSNKLYRDTSDHVGFEGKKGKITIGWGYNIDDNGLPKDILQELFNRKVNEAESDLTNHLPWTLQLDQNRREVLIDMVFNMGIERVLPFKATLSAIQAGKYAEAAGHMLDSLWSKQVGDRAKNLANIMRTGSV